jgi:hypothetical protein
MHNIAWILKPASITGSNVSDEKMAVYKLEHAPELPVIRLEEM